MIKISLVVPVQDFIKDNLKILEEHNEFENLYNTKNYKREYILEEIVAMEGEINQLHFDSDVIISRGITSEILKNIQKIPVVDIPVSGNDVLHCLHNIKSKYNAKKVGVIGSQNMIYGSKSISKIIGLDIEEYFLKNYWEGPILVEKAILDGCDAIIGGVITNNFAEKNGIPSAVIKTNKESFWQALTEAKRLAEVSRHEQAKTQMHKTILDHAYEGVLSVDNNNKIIVFNKAAKETLNNKEEDHVGKDVRQVLNNNRLINIIEDKNEYIDEIIKYNKNIQLVLNKVNIDLKGEKVGKILTFQDITGVQDLEGKIREKIHIKGHRAKYNFDNIIHKSKVIQNTINRCKKFSQVDSNILIIGDTGTGKELFAQSIHNYSKRKDAPFVALNCAALPENLLESELFGYAEGAFTGASKKGKLGYFELAHKGTLFLDEIGEISLNLQSRLLRALEEKEIMRIGDDKIIPVDVRIICATNKDLEKQVLEGSFREDLYYRLDVLRVNIPVLKERPEDIPLLVKHFVNQICNAYNIPEYKIQPEVLDVLKTGEWPGNIRQLRNFSERLVVLNSTNIIDLESLNRVMAEKTNDRLKFNDKKTSESSEITKELIENELIKNQYNKSKTAEMLGISRSTLWRRIKELEIQK